MRRILHGDNLIALRELPEKFARLAYLDPPFNTGRVQRRDRMRVRSVEGDGERTGFHGRRYSVERTSSASFADRFDDYVGFLLPRVEALLRCLTDDASIFVHLDTREVHYVKVALDRLLGRECFINEIIWSYDFGGRPRTRWPSKHDTILWYALDPESYVFDYDAIDRIPYMAPGLVSAEKAARGKTPTDVWWQTIVPTNSKEKTGYPTQKPLPILERIVRVHSRPGDVVIDPFAGSGTTAFAAAKHGRGFVAIDASDDAIAVMQTRLAPFEPTVSRVATSEDSSRTRSGG